ncbi:NAD(P)-dependent oxidoreductase [Agreia pratensis]|nr:NAD(P)-dependent oxidoreductase [Agreia pratensis]
MAHTASSDERLSIGMIGLGNMGTPMALNLLAAFPHSLSVTARSRDRAAAVLSAGASWVDTPADVAEASDVVVLMVPDLPQVDELLFGDRGMAETPATCVVVVCSSVSPTGIRATDDRLRQQTEGRMRIVDAPVSGGTEGAAAGTLSIMVGGTEADVNIALPLLSACGTPVHLGPLGSGDIAKACNQLIVAATMAAISEASVIAERSGLDLDALLTLLQGGYAGSRVLETKKDRLVERDYSPTGAARYMVKDLSFAHAAAVETATAAPILDALRGQFDGLVAAGLGDDDLAVIHRYIRDPEQPR